VCGGGREQSISELAQLMVDLAAIIDLNQENLDSIESNVLAAKEFVVVGIEEVCASPLPRIRFL
jgi:t-SNARE complex subunit (syntaxin)